MDYSSIDECPEHLRSFLFPYSYRRLIEGPQAWPDADLPVRSINQFRSAKPPQEKKICCGYLYGMCQTGGGFDAEHYTLHLDAIESDDMASLLYELEN